MNRRAWVLVALATCLGSSVAAGPLLAATLKAVKQRGTLIVGVDPTFSPFEFTDAKEKVVGFDPALIEAAAADMGLKVDYRVMEFSGILPGLIAGGFDVTPTLNVTAERAKQIDFVIPTAASTNAVLALKGGKVLSSRIEDLSGKTCAVLQTAQPEQMMTSMNDDLKAKGKTPVELMGFAAIEQSIAALASGRVDCVVDDKTVLVEAISKRPDIPLVLVGPIGGSTPFSWGVNKADGDLAAALSDEVRKLKANGTLAKLQAQYLGYTIDVPEKDFIPAN